MREDEPIHNYVVARGDDLRVALRIEFAGEPMDWMGVTAMLAVTGPTGTVLYEASSADTEPGITLVDPDDLDDEEDTNLRAVIPDSVSEVLAENERARYQVRMVESDGVKTTLLKGTIRASYAALEAE